MHHILHINETNATSDTLQLDIFEVFVPLGTFIFRYTMIHHNNKYLLNIVHLNKKL
jgi:hypothetical protein